MNLYKDQNGKNQYQCTSTNKSGGEGSIYLVQGTNEVIKVIHPGKMKQKHNKIEYMITHFKKLTPKQQQILLQFSAWPTDFVYDNKGNIIGYIMPKVTGIELSVFLTPIARKKYKYSDDYKLRVIYAYNLALCFEIIHQFFPKIALGDVSKGNVMVDQKGMIHLIDLDSVQIVDTGIMALSEVYTPGYASPERVKNPKEIITHASDDFTLAILLFELLMNHHQSATHPFVCLKSNGEGSGISIDQAITNGLCQYVNPSIDYKLPDQAKRLEDVLTTPLIQCFRNTFKDGIKDSSKRTTASIWRKEIEKYMKGRGYL